MIHTLGERPRRNDQIPKSKFHEGAMDTGSYKKGIEARKAEFRNGGIRSTFRRFYVHHKYGNVRQQCENWLMSLRECNLEKTKLQVKLGGVFC